MSLSTIPTLTVMASKPLMKDKRSSLML
ncbi:hypothetical protein GBAR_LOCUS25719 [Geodia barretti]|uniref:Uncharacterized protein n=1 Tax=Geodia barretti TaxID=519541 RepID=A0AA35XCJ9_GEOBA|nr:hypothetical protein GBAR_LOCUS25719 [Geodia barretti]